MIPPPFRPTDPSGGDGCRALLVPAFHSGDGPKPVPDGSRRLGGDTRRRLPVTSCVAERYGDEPRRLARLDPHQYAYCLPPAMRVGTALRTSAGEETTLPSTSRMTSPLCNPIRRPCRWDRPRSPTTPSPPFLGRRKRQAEPRPSVLPLSACSSTPARACRSSRQFAEGERHGLLPCRCGRRRA